MMLGIRGIMENKIFIDEDKNLSLDEMWKDNPKEYDRLIKKEFELEENLKRSIDLRNEIFEKMNMDDLDEQKHLVELIHNVVWWRELNMSKVKTKLEISFTPDLKRRLEEKMGDD
jgi:hypothetical protein